MLKRCDEFSSWLIKASRKTAGFKRNQRGVAAIEFALFGLFLSVGMLNAADIGIYLPG